MHRYNIHNYFFSQDLKVILLRRTLIVRVLDYIPEVCNTTG